MCVCLCYMTFVMRNLIMTVLAESYRIVKIHILWYMVPYSWCFGLVCSLYLHDILFRWWSSSAALWDFRSHISCFILILNLCGLNYIGWAESADILYFNNNKSNEACEYITISKYTHSFENLIQIHKYPISWR